MSLKDKNVIVTGGSRGLGLGLVEALVAHGANVTVVARDADALASVSIRLGVATISADITDQNAAHRILAEARPDTPLDLTVDSVKGHLARGRARLREINAQAGQLSEVRPASAAVARYVALFNQRDWDGLRALLADDVRLNQSTYPNNAFSDSEWQSPERTRKLEIMKQIVQQRSDPTLQKRKQQPNE
jgi:NAD(P)-dependent dehydrogenase (short-subunit alcohol dehydrogenase family)